MNFDESIYPLTEFLNNYNFSITRKEQHFIEYSSRSTIITIGYANLENLFYTHVGQDLKSLVELTPIIIKKVFNDDRFRLQSTLTIKDLISFFKTTGELIVSGDREVFKALNDHSEQLSTAYTKQIRHLQNIRCADEAWSQKHYAKFIQCIDEAEMDLLSEVYSKRYRIAVDKLQRRV